MRCQDREVGWCAMCVHMCEVFVRCAGVKIVLQVFVMNSCMDVTRIQHPGSGTVLGIWYSG